MEKNNHKTINKIYFNSLFVKLAITVAAGSLILSVSLFFMNMRMAQDVFVDIFADSQTKIFSQMEDYFYQLYSDVAQIAADVEGSEKVHAYLTGEAGDAAQEMGLIYAMQRQVSQMKINEYDNLTLLIAGLNGKSYLYSKADQVSKPLPDILAMPFTDRAAGRPGEIICEYVENGFTDATKNEPAVVYCRAIRKERGGEIIGYTYLIMKEADMRKRYDYFVSGTGDIIVLNQDNEVISTNRESYLKEDTGFAGLLNELVQEAEGAGLHKSIRNIGGEQVTCLVKRFPNTNLKMVGLLNPDKAFFVRYDLMMNLLLAALITIVSVGVVFVLVRRQTRPLYQLSDAMKSQKDGICGSLLTPEGTEEIQELARTYNEMITDLNHYITKVMETEKAKRSAELHALQMQINPHYIYNTLATIKWLIRQGSAEEATKTLDAFIALLRNTISNQDEFVSVSQEIVNVKNYVLINQKRYGDKIQVEFFMAKDCEECLLPKLVLQPFIENAFFHAFPAERRGSIHVFVQTQKDLLTIEIADNGVGMDRQDIETMLLSPVSREHFTGIGIKNVDERIKMIYGESYGIRVESEKGQGTRVILQIPAQPVR